MLLATALALLSITSGSHVTRLNGVGRAAPATARDWPHWRGPDGTGVAPSAGSLPETWSDESNVRWRVELPGRGASTPVAFGEHLFLTTAVALDERPAPGERGEFHGGGGPQAEHEFVVLAIERATGEVAWERTVARGTPREGFHRSYGSHASMSPVTDGERLIASFASQGVYCFDLAGELLWHTDPEVVLEMRRQFGGGASPVLHGDSVILNLDQEGPSFLLVLDAATGEERWRVARDEPSTWGTPLVTDVDGTTQVILSGTHRTRGYDLEDGRVVWECGGLGLNAIPNPLRHGDSVIVMSGYRDPNLMAIALGESGDLTDTDAVLWQNAKGASYTPSPVLLDGRLFCLGDRGNLSAFDAGSGAPLYVEERLPRGLEFKSSPIAVGDRLYLLAETGEVVVVRAADELEVLATIPALTGAADDMFVASPIALDGALYLRGMHQLIAIGGS